jgi:hypothetical protein
MTGFCGADSAFLLHCGKNHFVFVSNFVFVSEEGNFEHFQKFFRLWAHFPQ